MTQPSTITMRRSGLDLTDLNLFEHGDPHTVWAKLRREAPVHWNPGPGGGFWALTRYADVLAAYRDHETFSSAHGAILGGSYRTIVDTASGRMLVTADAPQHTGLRRRVKAVFSAEMIGRVTGQVETLVLAALKRLLQDGGGDFATEIAVQLPAGALMALFEIGHSDALELIRLTRVMIGYLDPDYAPTIDDTALRLAQVQADVFDFLSDLIDRRRGAAGQDAVSILMGDLKGERPLGEEALLFNLMNLAVGGNETTPHSASAGLLALVKAPDQWDRLADRPGELLPTAVDEVLRWSSTNAYVQRVLTRSVVVRGVELGEGDSVTLWNASANRDEEQFKLADRFDVDRRPNQHLAFGSGLHRCIGSGTARPELAALLRGLAEFPARLEQAGPETRLRSNFMLGIKSLPVTVKAARGEQVRHGA